MHLLDTNVISELRPGKREQSPQVRAWAAAQAFDTLYLCTVVVLELRVGMERKARTDAAQGAKLKAWIDALEQQFDGRILPFTIRAARICAPLHVPDPRSWRDSLIAATAIEHGFNLITRNVGDFEGIDVQVINPWAPVDLARKPGRRRASGKTVDEARKRARQ